MVRRDGTVSIGRVGSAVAIVAALALILSGCGDDDDEEPRNPPPEQTLALRADGFGPAAFGDPAQAVISNVQAELGAPDADTGLVAVSNGSCVGTRVRTVEWSGLQLSFTDGETMYEGEGTEHFFGWAYGGEGGIEPELATEQGLALGDPADDLVTRYGSAATLIPASGDRPALYQIDIGDELPLEAEMGSGDTVVALHGGDACRADPSQSEPPVPEGA